MPMKFEPLEKELFNELAVQTVLSLLKFDYREIDLKQTRGLYAGGQADLSHFQSVATILEHCEILGRDQRLMMHVPAIYSHLGDEPERFGIDLPWMVEAFLRMTWDYIPDNPWGNGAAARVGEAFLIQDRLKKTFLLFQKLGYARFAGNHASWTLDAGPLLYCEAPRIGIFTPDGILGYDEVVRMARTLPRELSWSGRAVGDSIVANHWYRNAWHKEPAFGDAYVVFLGAYDKAYYVSLYFKKGFPTRQDVLSGAAMKADFPWPKN